MSKGKLTAKQEKFISEYLLDLNATQASLRAGYSEKTAKQIGTENLSKPIIQEGIQRLRDIQLNKLDIDSEYVLKRLHEIDQLDVIDIFNDDMSAFKKLSEWPKSWRTSLSGIDINELFEFNEGNKELSGLVKKIKWPDKVRNLELLGKHIAVGAFKESDQDEQKAPPVTMNFYKATKDAD